MLENLPLLYELEITISGRVENSFPVKAILKEQGHYPPEPKREGTKIIFPLRNNVLQVSEVQVPASVLTDTIAPSVEASQRLQDLTSTIFPPGNNILDRLLSHAEPFDAYGPPRALCRITLVFESSDFISDERALEEVPWELMKWRGRDGEIELRHRCMILRRSRHKSGEKTGKFDLPINVALVDEVGLPGGMSEFGRNLFDLFTEDARNLGGIEWGELNRSPIKSGEVQHVMFDSSDVQRLARLYDGSWHLDVPPRLLILHDISGWRAQLNAKLVENALDGGCDAVLLASLPSPDPRADNFFPMFYRKLMHNWPLDQCLWAAQGVAHLNQMPVDSVIAAREGGEFGLLLTRAALEATQIKGRKKPKPRIMRGRKTRGARAHDIPRMQGERPVRAALELEDSLRRMAEDKRDRFFNTVADTVRYISFDEELHGVGEAVGARTKAHDMMHAATMEINETEELADGITAAEPETVQKALVRLTNLWITENDLPNEARVIKKHDYLVAARPYELHLQIGPRLEGALISERFNEESLRKVFEQVDEVTLDVMFFSTDRDFHLDSKELDEPKNDSQWKFAEAKSVDGKEKDSQNGGKSWGRRASLRLPRYGSSNELKIQITPKEAGMRRLRTCIYYRNVLLQSVLLEALVAGEGTEQASKGFESKETLITGRTTDYLATVDFALLDELPQPSLNVFTNHDQHGTHWVGVYSDGDTSAFQLDSGDMRAFDKGVLTTRAARMREIFLEIEGEKHSYKLNATLPLSDEDLKRREGYLRDLALSGWRLFHSTFISGSDGSSDSDNAERLDNLRNTIQDSHIISIARCGPDSGTLPWAATYSNSLDTNKEDQISLCGVFKKQLADNKWSGNTLVEKHDLLDDPKRCRSLPECPLQTQKRRLTVCPFGFWGFLHQVEQPLQQVKPTSVDEEPVELKNYNFGQTSFLTRTANAPAKLAIGAYPGIPDVSEHKAEIAALHHTSSLEMDYQDDRDQIMSMLTEGGQHFYYFYCHGDVDEQQKIFRLKLGPSPPGKPGYIESADLDPAEIRWETPNPLFIMNGCETMAVSPDVTHGFLNTLKRLGASGIIGTEEKVWTQLARPFGVQLLKHLLNGMSVGEAFLEVRKTLLRQYNPLGLMYSYYSPATLHLHDPAACTWCNTHKRTPTNAPDH